jgi:hypothetical protein
LIGPPTYSNVKNAIASLNHRGDRVLAAKVAHRYLLIVAQLVDRFFATPPPSEGTQHAVWKQRGNALKENLQACYDQVSQQGVLALQWDPNGYIRHRIESLGVYLNKPQTMATSFSSDDTRHPIPTTKKKLEKKEKPTKKIKSPKPTPKPKGKGKGKGKAKGKGKKRGGRKAMEDDDDGEEEEEPKQSETEEEEEAESTDCDSDDSYPVDSDLDASDSDVASMPKRKKKKNAKKKKEKMKATELSIPFVSAATSAATIRAAAAAAAEDSAAQSELSS